MILRPPPRKPRPLDLLTRRLRHCGINIARDCSFVNSYVLPVPAKEVLDRILPLYQLLPLPLVQEVLIGCRRHSRRQSRLPAHAVVWLVVGQSLFRDRSLGSVFRHLHSVSFADIDDVDEPDDSAFSHARKRLGAEPMRHLFHRVVEPLGQPGMASVFHRHWRVMALDGSVFEMPDTAANRAHFGSSGNQHGPAAFPQMQIVGLCEVGTHILSDVEFGPYKVSEQALSERLLRRLPEGALVLMDRGLSYYRQVRLVLLQKSHVLARVKAEQRELPVEQVLPDGSYLSAIHPSYNHKRAGKGGIAVRVIRYTHDDPGRDGAGEESCLITTLLDPADLSAKEAIALYPWRREEESTLKECKAVLLKSKEPLFRSKTPELVEQELYGLLLAHFLVRSVMVAAALLAEVEPCRLGFKRSLEIVEDYLMQKPGRCGERRWLAGLLREVSRQQLRAKVQQSNPRVKKVTRSKWPGKKDEHKGRVHEKSFAFVSRIVSPGASPATAQSAAGPAACRSG